MPGIVERISAKHLSTNVSNNPRMELLDHPGTGILRRDWIGGIEPLGSRFGKAILRIISRMSEYKYQFNARRLELFQPFLYQSTSDALILAIRVYR